MKVCTIWLLEVLCILSTLKIVNTSVNTSREPNTKITTQSSNHIANYSSDKAVDGCRKQIFDSQNCCSHTQTGQKEAWWQVDLEGLIVMGYVKIYYRDQGYQQRQRFGGYRIYQSNTSDWRNGFLCHKDTTSTLAALSLTPEINCTGSARYLTIYSDRRSGGLKWYFDDAILELCEVEVYGCPLGKYGDGNCDSDCDVGCASSLCDPVTGGCAYCAAGYYRSGSVCVECPSNCYDNICNAESGVCSACTPGSYGSRCNQTCSFNCKDNRCMQSNGECEDCEDGFFGSSCDDCSVGCTNHVCDKISGNCSPCKPGYFGDPCITSCPSNCKSDICYQTSGLCTECAPGFYGIDCKQTCPAHCRYSLCARSSGDCSVCAPGYYGVTCNTSCPSNCKGTICNQTSGLCTECAVGFYGGFCSQLCPIKCKNIVCNLDNGQCKECVTGLYGTECNQSCPVNCQDTLCHRSSGECKVCEAGFYGSQCLKSCGSCQGVSCDKDTGDCATGCTDGWTGNECDNKVVLITNGDSTVGIGVGSGVVILVLVIVIIVLVRRRTMKRGDTTGPSHMTDISLSRTAKELKQNQDNTYDEIATYNKEETIAQISHNEANYEQLGRREVEIPHVYETTDVDRET